MAIIAKFFISEKTKMKISSHEGQPVYGYKIKGYPVYQGDEENKKFFASTPSGTLELATVNKAAADQIEPGDEVFITIEKAVS
jgi:hypothetical protein